MYNRWSLLHFSIPQELHNMKRVENWTKEIYTKGNGEGFSIDHQPECLTARLMERHVSLLGYYSTLRSAEQMALHREFIEFVSQLIDHAHELLVCVFDRVFCSTINMLLGQLGDKHHVICPIHM